MRAENKVEYTNILDPQTLARSIHSVIQCLEMVPGQEFQLIIWRRFHHSHFYFHRSYLTFFERKQFFENSFWFTICVYPILTSKLKSYRDLGKILWSSFKTLLRSSQETKILTDFTKKRDYQDFYQDNKEYWIQESCFLQHLINIMLTIQASIWSQTFCIA